MRPLGQPLAPARDYLSSPCLDLAFEAERLDRLRNAVVFTPSYAQQAQPWFLDGKTLKDVVECGVRL